MLAATAIEAPGGKTVVEPISRVSELTGAVGAWNEIAENDDNDRDALDQLARIYRGSKRAEERTALVEVLGRAARLATSGDDESALRTEIARLESDGPRAVVH